MHLRPSHQTKPNVKETSVPSRQVRGSWAAVKHEDSVKVSHERLLPNIVSNLWTYHGPETHSVKNCQILHEKYICIKTWIFKLNAVKFEPKPLNIIHFIWMQHVLSADLKWMCVKANFWTCAEVTLDKTVVESPEKLSHIWTIEWSSDINTFSSAWLLFRYTF